MSDEPLLTAEEFLETRFDLPEGGQWAELEAGRVVLLQPPDLDHGNTILNLSKAIARWAAQAGGPYAVFDLGLVMRRRPDTVRVPAVSFFAGGEPFAETDKEVTETVPALVIELASTAERREAMPARVDDYLRWGVQSVWIIDPMMRAIEQIDNTGSRQRVGDVDRLTGRDVSAGLDVAVAELFVEPEWWSHPGPRRPRGQNP